MARPRAAPSHLDKLDPISLNSAREDLWTAVRPKYGAFSGVACCGSGSLAMLLSVRSHAARTLILVTSLPSLTTSAKSCPTALLCLRAPGPQTLTSPSTRRKNCVPQQNEVSLSGVSRATRFLVRHRAHPARRPAHPDRPKTKLR